MLIDQILDYRTAKQHIQQFSDEADDFLQEHHEAIECLNCESYLQLGIEAFRWLRRADAAVTTFARQGKLTPTIAIDAAIESLYRGWLVPCAFADRWIDTQASRGFQLKNLTAFRECETEARSIVHEIDRLKLLESKVPSAVTLDQIATPPPSAWLNEASLK